MHQFSGPGNFSDALIDRQDPSIALARNDLPFMKGTGEMGNDCRMSEGRLAGEAAT